MGEKVRLVFKYIDTFSEKAGRAVSLLALILMAIVVIGVVARYVFGISFIWGFPLNKQIFGMFMDDFAIIIICAPIFMPIALSLGFDPIWFAIVFILNMQMAYMTPPFGWCLILMKGIAPPEVSTTDIWRSVPPFVGMQLLVLVLVMVLPQLAIWLPGKMM